MSLSKKSIAGFFFLLFSTTGLLAQDALQTEVTDAELEKFAMAFQGIRMMNQQAQQQMASEIEDGDLSIQRFNEIHKASLDPAVEVELSEEEEKKYKAIVAEIEEMQVDFQKQMEEIIQKRDLTVDRYRQIATQLETDSDLQERLRETFKKD